METIIIEDDDKWPEGISDGLTLPCGLCGRIPIFDYIVTDDLWKHAVPIQYRRGIVCLECLSGLCSSGVLVSNLIQIQLTVSGATVVLKPESVYFYNKTVR